MYVAERPLLSSSARGERLVPRASLTVPFRLWAPFTWNDLSFELLSLKVVQLSKLYKTLYFNRGWVGQRRAIGEVSGRGVRGYVINLLSCQSQGPDSIPVKRAEIGTEISATLGFSSQSSNNAYCSSDRVPIYRVC